MENSEKQKIDTEEEEEEVTIEGLTETDPEKPDRKVETEAEVVSAEVDSGTKTGETVATSDGTVVAEKAEKVSLVSDQAIVEDGVSERAEVAADKTEKVAAEKTEDVAAAFSDSATEKLEEAALPTSDTNVGESSGVADSAPKENLATNGTGGNQGTFEIPRSTENLQFVAATPRTRTSWTNCCGLWDLLRRSNQ